MRGSGQTRQLRSQPGRLLRPGPHSKLHVRFRQGGQYPGLFLTPESDPGLGGLQVSERVPGEEDPAHTAQPARPGFLGVISNSDKGHNARVDAGKYPAPEVARGEGVQ